MFPCRGKKTKDCTPLRLETACLEIRPVSNPFPWLAKDESLWRHVQSIGHGNSRPEVSMIIRSVSTAVKKINDDELLQLTRAGNSPAEAVRKLGVGRAAAGTGRIAGRLHEPRITTASGSRL